MNRVACQYAIVRFMPFVETGEFANVGIVMMSARERFFGFKLLTRRHARVTDFFDQLEAKVFKNAMADITDEFVRVRQLLMEHGFDRRRTTHDTEFAKGVFAELIRPREVMLRFSEPRSLLVTDPAKALDELFAHYVERNFVTREYREALMEKGIRAMLRTAHIAEHFVRREVGNDAFHVTFPFVAVENEKVRKVIKPLDLAHTDSSAILEKGGLWKFRLEELRKKACLPEQVLFVVEEPADEAQQRMAYSEAVAMLDEAGVAVLPYHREQAILQFAAAPLH
jgi:hypothetical protein